MLCKVIPNNLAGLLLPETSLFFVIKMSIKHFVLFLHHLDDQSKDLLFSLTLPYNPDSDKCPRDKAGSHMH